MIDLASAGLRATISPSDGGCITGLHGDVRGKSQPILQDDPVQGDTPLALSSGLFAMLPFANRAAENLLWAADQSYIVSPNTPAPLALHGTGWQQPWRVLNLSAQTPRLDLQVDASTYAFTCDAVLTFTLSQTTLRLPVGEIALLPADLLAVLQSEIVAAAKQMRAVTTRFDTTFELRFAMRPQSGRWSLAAEQTPRTGHGPVFGYGCL